MIIQIEDYFGNDLVRLNYNQIMFKGTNHEFKLIDEIAQVDGYNIADIDRDNVGSYYRLQAVEIFDDSTKQREQLYSLITRLNKQFL